MSGNGHEKLELFEKLYDEHSAAIYRFLFLRLKSKEIAEDITQDVFLKILPRIKDSSLRAETTLPYLYTVARNALVDYYRKKKCVLFEEDDDMFFAPSEDSADNFAIAQDDRSLIAAAFSHLGEDQKSVLTLFYMEEMSFVEIASVIGKSEDTVRQIKSRAQKKVREYIEQYAPQYDRKN
jgi:RNA polymerase sigma-70 factor (ECF subfamily)